MKKDFPGIGEVVVQILSFHQIQEAIDLIYGVYQQEKIWTDYTKDQIRSELEASFQDTCYRPVYFVALLGNKMIGIAGFMESFISSEAYELSFATILPQYQNKGLGTWLVYLRLKEIVRLQKNALVLTRTRASKIFEKFNFRYMYKTMDTDGSAGAYDYMFCPAQEANFSFIER